MPPLLFLNVECREQKRQDKTYGLRLQAAACFHIYLWLTVRPSVIRLLVSNCSLSGPWVVNRRLDKSYSHHMLHLFKCTVILYPIQLCRRVKVSFV